VKKQEEGGEDQVGLSRPPRSLKSTKLCDASPSPSKRDPKEDPLLRAGRQECGDENGYRLQHRRPSGGQADFSKMKILLETHQGKTAPVARSSIPNRSIRSSHHRPYHDYGTDCAYFCVIHGCTVQSCTVLSHRELEKRSALLWGARWGAERRSSDPQTSPAAPHCVPMPNGPRWLHNRKSQAPSKRSPQLITNSKEWNSRRLVCCVSRQHNRRSISG
jgi:hypothetical protein